jgi:hypothetical protein
MFRFAGTMYGAFWLFRIFLMVTGPLLREWETASILISIWTSAPAGLLIADVLRRRWDARPMHYQRLSSIVVCHT